MLTAKVTPKGQITIPKEVRDQLGVHPGENLGFEEKNGLFFIKKQSRNLYLINGLECSKPVMGRKQMK